MTTAADPFAGYVFEPVEAPRFAAADRRPWARYGRISRRDPREGFGAHVKIEDQLDQALAYINAHDPDAEVLTFRDNASAFLPDAHRPEFDRMVAMLAAGELKGIVPIHVDRLTRQMVQASTVWAHLERTGAQLHTVHGGWIKDPTMWQFETMQAERESRVKRERAQNHHRRLAAAGGNHGGKRRFGYNDAMTEFNEREAEALRSIAARVLGGESLASCVRWLEAEGIESAGGGKWTGSNLSTMLRRPMLAGLRVHGRRDDGTWRVVAKATWPPVFDLETHEALVRKLGDPARRTSTSNKSKYLLAGIARCECGEFLRGRPGRKVRDREVYVCVTGRHVYRDTAVVDDAVVAAVVARLSKVSSAGVFVDDSAEAEEAALTVKRDALLARRKSYATKAALGQIDDDMAAEVAEAITAELAAVGVALDAVKDATTAPLAVLDGMTGPLAQAAWDGAAIGRRREVIRIMVESITLAGGGGPWDPAALLSVEFCRRPGVVS